MTQQAVQGICHAGVKSDAVETSEFLDAVGSLVSQIKTYSTKLPAVVPMASVPQGLKPTPEVVESFERTVARFRERAAGTVYQRLNDLIVETLEAFESGWVLKAVQTLLMVVDQLELMQREKTITASTPELARLQDYRHTLHKILPGNQPELEGAGKWM